MSIRQSVLFGRANASFFQLGSANAHFFASRGGRPELVLLARPGFPKLDQAFVEAGIGSTRGKATPLSVMSSDLPDKSDSDRQGTRDGGVVRKAWFFSRVSRIP